MKFKFNKGAVFTGVTFAVMQMVAVVITVSGAIYTASSKIVVDSMISQASYAKFVQEFSDYGYQVTLEANELQANNANNGEFITKTQAFYMVANGYELKSEHESIAALPNGYIVQDELYDALYPNKEETQGVIAYIIHDEYIENYEKADYKFYGDSNGKEYHLITNYGDIFTLPGFPQEQEDGTIRYYINAKGDYYIVSRDSETDNALKYPIRIENLGQIK